MTKYGKWMQDKPWSLSYIGTIAVFLVIAIMHGKGIPATITTTLSFAVFSVIVGIGQMLVMTTGPGNIDLSIPSVMTLGGAIAMKVANEQASQLPIALVLVIIVGIAIGAANYGIIRMLKIPPIIATLSTNMIVLSIAISYERGLRIHPPENLYNFSVAPVYGDTRTGNYYSYICSDYVVCSFTNSIRPIDNCNWSKPECSLSGRG